MRPQLPATLGAECVGRIASVGSNVRQLAAGDRVINLGRDNWCQRRKVPAAQALAVPGDADVLQLAMLKVNPATALMLRSYMPLQPGDWVIQDAANSGVGTNLIRLAKADGIRTVNVVRRSALDPLQAIGADVVVVDGDDLAARVQGATGGASIRLAIDAIGGAMVLRLADCLAEGGTVVNYGLLSGQPCQLGAHHTIFKGITLTGFWLQKALTSMARPESKPCTPISPPDRRRHAPGRGRGDLSDRGDQGGARPRRARWPLRQDPGAAQRPGRLGWRGVPPDSGVLAARRGPGPRY